MGRRCFLIAFTDAKQITKFFQWKQKIACVISDFADLKDKEGDNIYTWTHSYRHDCLTTLVEFATKYSIEYKSQYQGGDYDLDLIGLTYWKGMIWGLINTYTVGEDVFLSLMRYILPDNFWTRTSYLPAEYSMNSPPIFLKKENDMEEFLAVYFGFPNSTHWEKYKSPKLVNYDFIHKQHFDQDKEKEKDEEYEQPDREIDFTHNGFLIQLIDKALTQETAMAENLIKPSCHVTQ